MRSSRIKRNIVFTCEAMTAETNLYVLHTLSTMFTVTGIVGAAKLVKILIPEYFKN